MVSLRRLKLKARRIGVDVSKLEKCNKHDQVFKLIDKLNADKVKDEPSE